MPRRRFPARRLAMAALLAFAASPAPALPDAGRTLTEIARTGLPAAADGGFEMTPDGRLALGLETGRTVTLALPGS